MALKQLMHIFDDQTVLMKLMVTPNVPAISIVAVAVELFILFVLIIYVLCNEMAQTPKQWPPAILIER
jgi:hypothetical protein